MGEYIDHDDLLRKLVSIQYTRNDTALSRGRSRLPWRDARVFPAYAETAYRIVLFGDEVEHLQHFDPVTGEVLEDGLEHVGIWPASHYKTCAKLIEDAVAKIAQSSTSAAPSSRARASCSSPIACASAPSTTWRCSVSWASARGSRNYSRILDGRNASNRPYCLLDYFPTTSYCSSTNRTRTRRRSAACTRATAGATTCVDYGLRLPSALDNRPQTLQEFLSITPQMVFVSATPGDYERRNSPRMVDDRPPQPGSSTPLSRFATRNQIDDLMNEIVTSATSARS